MNIKQFINNFKNHPVLFVGTGLSLRYLKQSYTWDALLKHISFELTGDEEYYLDLKSSNYSNSKYNYDRIASDLEGKFNSTLKEDRNGKFKDINDSFYENAKKGINVSRFKLYIASLFKLIELKEEKEFEINELKKIRKNIGSIITTNYDQFIEEIFEFNPLIGNDILLSNPYGSVYKIHGCVSSPDKIIITHEDYKLFERKYELIRAQLLSLFIHNPIIFIGYSINDENIRDLLKTIFTYVPEKSEIADRIKSNFLLIEFEEGINSEDVYEHDITIDDHTTIRVNKIKTDNFVSIYKALSSLQLPISAMDIRKVQNIVKDIYEGGAVQVNITADIDNLNNNDKVLAIGTVQTVSYVYQTASEMMANYFNILDEENVQLLDLIDKQNIQKNQYFPIMAFSCINKHIERKEQLKLQQLHKLREMINSLPQNCKKKYSSISEILSQEEVSKSNITNSIIYTVLNDEAVIDEFEQYLRKYNDKKNTNYRKMLCLYDYLKYGSKYDLKNF